MARIFAYRGKSTEELKKMDIKEFAQLLPSRERRSLLRGMNDAQKKVLEHVKNGKAKVRTHCREMVIVPALLGATVHVHSGKEWVVVRIEPEMLGHRLGEFAQTRKRIAHSAPGVGATRSSAALSVR